MTLVSHNERTTEDMGRRIAAQLTRGDAVLLYGDLGAGKSVFARGIGRGLGVTGPMPSPTFTMLLPYRTGRLPLYHFDLYRLEDSDAFYAMGFDEFLDGDGVSLIEWPTRCPEAMPQRALRVDIAYGERETARTITLTPLGGFALDMDTLSTGGACGWSY